MRLAIPLFAAACAAFVSAAEPTTTFDGRPWNVSTGNASVTFIQHSPVGAFPQPNYLEPPPAAADLKRLHDEGLVAYEDYIAWGAVEREPGKWDFAQHDAMEKAMHAAGMKYVVYDWAHFPPTWLRNSPDATLLRCMDHDQPTNYLSVFDPRTVAWYDHFYKAVHDHFGDRIDDMYACVLGPYGEGNYPLRVPDWINMGHCHEGYWCADPAATKSFIAAMRAKYADVAAMNAAWGTKLASFDEVRPPRELKDEKFKPTPAAFPTAQDKRRWLDFIEWYHQAIIDFAGNSAKALLKYYPPQKVRLKPGGTAAGINPIPWGTYSPGYAKMAKGLGIVLQPADSQGAVFADKWLGTAYTFYGVKLGTEPASGLDAKAFHRRVFSDVGAGASQIFTYEFEQHAADIAKYAHLYTGKPGETAVAVYCPTTLWRLGGDVWPTIRACNPLRDLCEFDVLDELLISDGALTPAKYKALVIFQADVVDEPILKKVDAFIEAGGKVIRVGDAPIRGVSGAEWQTAAKLPHTPDIAKDKAWLTELAKQLSSIPGVDGQLDGLWTSHRGSEVLLFNPTAKPIKTTVDHRDVEVAPYEIWEGN